MALPLTEYIPLAALAAVLVMVAYDMSDSRTVRHIFQGPKSDWSVDDPDLRADADSRFDRSRICRGHAGFPRSCAA